MKPLARHIIPLLLLTLSCTAAFSQQYGNEWIEYNLTYYKFNITRAGVYRIPRSLLASQPQVDTSQLTGSKFNLFNLGQTVPIYVTTTGLFGNNDYIEFYAKPNDGSFDAYLYSDPGYQPNPASSLFNDTAVYYLTWNSVKPNILIANIPNTLTNLPAKEQYYMNVVRVNYNANYQLGKPTYIGSPLTGGQPVYESIFDEGEGFYGSSFSPGSPGYVNVVAPQIYTAAPVSPALEASIVSISQTPHTLEFNFNSFLGDTSFYNFRLGKYNFTIPLSQLSQYNMFSVVASGLGTADLNAIAYVQLTYPREFIFPSESRTNFTINAAGAGARYLEISAFNDRSTNPILYDLTNHLRIVGTSGGNPLKFKLPAQTSGAKRELFLTSQNTSDLQTISSLERVNFINFYDQNNQGDYIILTHPKLRNDGNNNDYIGEYAKYRGSLQGGEYTVEVVLINQLYDQFAYGIRKHPLAVRNFIDFALANWTEQPEHLFIIGKGREYNNIRNSSAGFGQCLVPTFGNPGSDALLTATNASFTPRVAVGRLSIENPVEINYYLEKVMAYERIQQEAGDPHQTIDEKAWMKRILHMGGGEGSGQQQQFKNYLESYERVIEDTLFGGNTYSFYKTSTDPIQIVQSDFIRDLINTGVSLITFFGHSSPNSFDIAIDDPDDFGNFEKYHLVLSNGCFTGNIYNPDPGISEDFVLTPNKAAIGFISTISLSSYTGLNYYSSNFYRNLGQDYYGSTIGVIMRHTVEDMENAGLTAIDKTIAEEMTLHGDPGLHINPHPKPDYAIEPQMVSFSPDNITVSQDSFTIRVIVTNLGKAVNDSIDLIVTRHFPNVSDGSVSYVKRMRGTYFSDTVSFTIPTGSSNAFGLNEFFIKVDNAEEISELSETNNSLGGLQINITSEDVFPIQPYEFAIVPSQPITLKASTANPFAPVTAYRMEIDTTELFNSPLLQSTTITQAGGVLTWTPSLLYTDSVVYYWRVGVEGRGVFHNSSFIYLDGEYPGWNQSHYYQFLKDEYNNIFLDSSRIFKFIGDAKTVSVKTGTADLSGGPVPWDQIAHYLNNGLKHRWVCGGGGFPGGLVLAVFDSASGNSWVSRLSNVGIDPVTGFSYNTIYKNIHCKQRDFEGFDFPTIFGSSTATVQQRIVDFINSVPDGDYILAYSVNSAYYNSWGQPLIDAFLNLGSQELPGMLGNSNIPWAFFAKKGHPNTATEMRMNSSNDILEFSATFNASWNQGTITTPLIGPAYEWGSMHWKYHAQEPQNDDQQGIDIIGVTPSGSEAVLDTNITNLDYFITHISAATYPYIKLRLDTRDDTARTPTQLDYWRVLYKKVPEAALNPAFHFSFRDSMNLGEPIELSMAVENVTDVHMDSLLVKYTLQSVGASAVNEFVRYDSLRALRNMNLEWTFNTDCNCLGDVNTLTVEVNPIPQNSSTNAYDQLEQFHYNNIATLSFKLDKDRINPLLDVTFDGVHILDGDIVSAEPEILIRLKDENKYLLLNDTALINVFIIDPNKVQTKMKYDGTTMQFTPASGSGNTAEVRLKKILEQDGVYTLLVQAKDRSRNVSGTYGIPQQGIDYRISFEVIREAMITNVLNYPNPFTSSTRFVFTLTGVQPPDFFKIQIMTVSGKVVRELTQADLGALHIGKNITEFAWDGTDQYGDPLANGLYLYRVVASINGESIAKWENGPDKNTDKYFKSGFGKMYLAR